MYYRLIVIVLNARKYIIPMGSSDVEVIKLTIIHAWCNNNINSWDYFIHPYNLFILLIEV